MSEIVNHILENQLYYNDTVVLKYKIQFPQLTRTQYRYGMKKFNEYNYNNAIELK